MKKLVKKMYSEMVDADKKAFAIMGKAICGDNKDVELEFDRLSTKAITIENLLLSRVNEDKKELLLNTAKSSKEIHTFIDCFLIYKEVIMSDNDEDFLGWSHKISLFTKSHEMTADEFWNMYKNYL